MLMKTVITSTLVTVALTLASPAGSAQAKNGGQGGGHESSGGHSSNGSGQDKSDRGHSKAAAKGGDETGNGKNRSNDAKPNSKIAKADTAERAGLSSLKRNYHAYLNSNDPRFADVFAYVRGYAEYEVANGVDAIPPGAAYSDETLREALATAAGTTTISDASLEWAKGILGVGDEIGKIDQVRETLIDEAQAD